MKTNIAIRTVIVLALCFALIGCTSAQILSNISLALNAAEAILPIVLPLLNSSGSTPVISPAKAAEILSWTQSALTGLDAVSACQKTGGTSAQLAACVTSSLAGVVAAVPDLSGLPASIATAVQNLATAVGNILKTCGTSALGTSGGAKAITYSAADQAKFDGFRARIAADHAKIATALAGR